MPRITSGIAKNKKILVPDIPNIRVVQDIFKLAVFSIIGDSILDSKCLDLYAGSGSFGLEALSRGASHCDFVDESYKAHETIIKNLKNCKLQENANVFQDNCIKFASNTLEKYNIIFVDPFYKDTKLKFLFENLEEILKPNGIIIFSHGAEIDILEQISNTKLNNQPTRRYGKSNLTILTH